MDEQSIQQKNQATQQPLRVRAMNAKAVPATERRKPTAEPGLAMLVNVIPRDEDIPGFVRGYN